MINNQKATAATTVQKHRHHIAYMYMYVIMYVRVEGEPIAQIQFAPSHLAVMYVCTRVYVSVMISTYLQNSKVLISACIFRFGCKVLDKRLLRALHWLSRRIASKRSNSVTIWASILFSNGIVCSVSSAIFAMSISGCYNFVCGGY